MNHSCLLLFANKPSPFLCHGSLEHPLQAEVVNLHKQEQGILKCSDLAQESSLKSMCAAVFHDLPLY